jgi:zinc/manganese transport system substrate-binding protein
MLRRSRLGSVLTATAMTVAVAVGTAACGSGSAESSDRAPAGTIQVVTSTNVWGAVVAAVGGDAVSVRSLIDDPSADPHAYEVKPADATAIADARLAVYNGGGYDDFFARLTETASGIRTINAVDVAGKNAEGTNEHVWYDFASVRSVATTIADELGAIDPAHKDTFAGNARTLGADLDALTAKLAAVGATHQGASFAATEPVADYLLEAAGLANATPRDFAEAIEEETDPSPAAVDETTTLVTEKKVLVLVTNIQTETPVTDALVEAARAAGVAVVEVTETVPQNATGYLDWMTSQVDALSTATRG